MKNTTAPPSMIKEQRAEIKELRRRESALTRQIDTASRQAWRQIGRLDDRLELECEKINRAAERAKKMIERTISAERRPLNSLAMRIQNGKTPETRELAAIQRRLSILDGRLNS